jgi:uncharacterized protein YabE (DUF348 family)
LATGERLSINASSYVSNVASHLQQLTELRQQQTEVDLEAGEKIRQARDEAVEQSMQILTKQVERVTEIKKAALQLRSGGIDVWA